MINYILQDWKYNSHDIKIRIVLISFRLCQFLWNSNLIVRLLSFPFFMAYRVAVTWLLNIDLLPNTKVGRRLKIYHGMALVIHPASIIGNDVTLRHSTTIGNQHSGGNAPRIGDRVNIGCHSVILGNIIIGDDATIGAGSVVTKDVAPLAVVAGNPAKLVCKRSITPD